MQFVSAGQGWAVGQDVILATADGGAHWRVQLSGALNLTAVDFVNRQDGWAAGNTSLLATTDGGAHWKALPEPCPLIRSVHFISPSTGFAVAGGRNDDGYNPAMPDNWRGGAGHRRRRAHLAGACRARERAVGLLQRPEARLAGRRRLAVPDP